MDFLFDIALLVQCHSSFRRSSYNWCLLRIYNDLISLTLRESRERHQAESFRFQSLGEVKRRGDGDVAIFSGVIIFGS